MWSSLSIIEQEGRGEGWGRKSDRFDPRWRGQPGGPRGGGRGSAQAKLRLARSRLASELGHLALSEAALEQVVDAVAARRQEIELTELLLYRGTVEDLRGDAEGGVGCEREGVVS
mgnify:CR=1 FL=1